MAQFTIYRSTDASAPVLDGNGATNNLINLLHKILVAGYGSKSGAGWTEPFTNTATKGVWRPASGTRFYLRVLDDGSMTGAQRDTSVRGGESMSDIDTFTNAFPTAAQATNGLNWRKSTTADGTARPWIALADDRTLYLFIQTGDTSAGSGFWPMFMFGDFFSYKAADTHNAMIWGAAIFSASSINFAQSSTYQGDLITNSMQTTQTGVYKARIAAETGTSVSCAKKSAAHLMLNATSNTLDTLIGGLAYPNAADGGLYLHPIWIMDGTTPDVIHGELRGLFHQLHPPGFFSDGDTVAGAIGSGKTYLMIKKSPGQGSNVNNGNGVWTLETSATLRTN